jgi:hypothetical protein
MINGFFVMFWKWHCIYNADASMSRFIAGEALVSPRSLDRATDPGVAIGRRNPQFVDRYGQVQTESTAKRG